MRACLSESCFSPQAQKLLYEHLSVEPQTHQSFPIPVHATMAFTSSLGLVCYWCDPGVIWGNPQLPVTSRATTLEETGTAVAEFNVVVLSVVLS